VGTLALTHHPPWNDPEAGRTEARETWAGPLDVAAPGRVYDLPGGGRAVPG
jgi:hypothetical protein